MGDRIGQHVFITEQKSGLWICFGDLPKAGVGIVPITLTEEPIANASLDQKRQVSECHFPDRKNVFVYVADEHDFAEIQPRGQARVAADFVEPTRAFEHQNWFVA